MRHRNGGFKLGRNTSHRRALLRNLVTSIILNDRVHTTITKAKAARPIVEKMITLGKNGSVHSRRQALAYMMTAGVGRSFVQHGGAALCDRVRRILPHRAHGTAQGRCGEMAYIELLGAEQELNEKAEKRAEARAKRREELQKQLDEHSAVNDGSDPNAQP